MTKIETKALELVSNKLNDFDTYSMFQVIYNIFEKYNDINSDLRKEVFASLQSESNKLKEIVKDSKIWVDVVIENK